MGQLRNRTAANAIGGYEPVSREQPVRSTDAYDGPLSRFTVDPVEPGPNALVVRVPADLTGRSELFDVLEAGLRFPYFGKGWDALLDVISDLWWLDVAEVWIIHDRVPVALGPDWLTYVDVLTDAVDRRNAAVSRGFPDRPELVVALPARASLGPPVQGDAR